MSFKALILPEAAKDAEEAYLHIADRSPDNAVRWYDGLLDAMFSLAEMPGRFPLAPESRYLGEEIRHLIYGNYRVLYIIDKPHKVVRIVHVRHAARRAIGEEGPAE